MRSLSRLFSREIPKISCRLQQTKIISLIYLYANKGEGSRQYKSKNIAYQLMKQWNADSSFTLLILSCIWVFCRSVDGHGESVCTHRHRKEYVTALSRNERPCEW